jgi:hypothetical protein
MFEEPPGSYDICKICFWEDDMFQLRFQTLDIGANNASLIEARRNYKKFGASELKLKQYTRLPTKKDKRDTNWRIFDPAKDIINKDFYGVARDYEWEKDKLSLYYWR